MPGNLGLVEFPSDKLRLSGITVWSRGIPGGFAE
jgi:hypothetical protein